MVATVQMFRESFPQFDAERFPDSRVGFFLTLAGKQMNAERWDDLLMEGSCLFAAHHLTLERAAMQTTDGTGGMEAAAGPVISRSKSVGGVSKSESRAGTAATGDPAAGQWNLTYYGQQYWQMSQLVGAGALYV